MRARTAGSPVLRAAIAGFTVAAVSVVGACDFNIANPNNPASIGPNATAAQVDHAAQGLLAALRIDLTSWVLKGGVIGRENYRLDASDPRFTTELLEAGPDPSNAAFGGGQWQREYRAIGAGYKILNVIGSAQITDAQKNAVRGFVQTVQALAFLMVLNAHIQDSIPIDVNRPVGGPLAPFVKNDSAYKAVAAILDSAKGNLQNGGASFPFDPGSGFAGFSTPTTFLEVNRALMARVQAYRASLGQLPVAITTSYGTTWSACPACWDAALTALGESFIDPAASLDEGAYMPYSTGNQDVPNDLSQDPATAIQLAHPLLKDSAETQVGGVLLDKRLLAKVTDRPDTLKLSCLASALSWTRYPSPNSPVPLIRNEELILLRAEANWFAATGSKSQAIADLNFIRQTSGGLVPTTVTVLSSDAAFLDDLLRQRLYSLAYEGGHHWLDMRRYGRINDMKIDRPSGCASSGITKPDVVLTTLPINSFEVQAQ